jgi:hypothetical protein
MSEQQTQSTNLQTQSQKNLILDLNYNIGDLKTFDAIAFTNR